MLINCGKAVITYVNFLVDRLWSKGNCIGFFIFLFITFSDRYQSVFHGKKKELVLLVELYERYGQLKTHHTHTLKEVGGMLTYCVT